MTDKTNKTDKHITIDGDSPVKNDLMFWRIVGHETLSRPSTYELMVLSKKRKLEPKDILGYAFDVVIHILDHDGNEHKRHCQGHAVRFMRGERLVGEDGQECRIYRIVLRSWFWLLTKRINSRILQKKTVPDIASAIFVDSPIKAITKIDTNNLTEQHNPRRYCVQHQESDYQFLSRLFEDEGIYYWFDVYDTGNALGTMHLSDTSSIAHERLPLYPSLKYPCPNGTVHGIVHQTCVSQLDSGRHASRDVNYKNIKTPLKPAGPASQNYEFGNFEVFEYPGGYFTNEQANEALRTRKDELSYRSIDLKRSLTHWRGVGVGRRLSINEHNGLIVTCTFVVSRSNYKNLQNTKLPQQPVTAILREALADDAVNAHCLDDYVRLIDSTPELCTNEYGTSAFLITTLPVTVPFKPPRLTPRVTMPGPQSAIVVGPEGKELHVDEGEDRMGRVKVQFHWDRYGDENENSTCWIRVSQPWAGKNWGAYFMPRIGQEVLVDFVNGDPDRPVIVGRLYNDDQPIPPYKPTQSGFRTHSTSGGSPSNYNEIMFEDEKGEELLNIQAEKDMKTLVKNDQNIHVMHDRTKTVDNDETITIGASRYKSVGTNEILNVGVAQIETVGLVNIDTVLLARMSNIGLIYLLDVGLWMQTLVGAVQDTRVGSDYRLKAGNEIKMVTGESSFKANKDGKINLEGKNYKLKASENIYLEGKQYELKASENINIETDTCIISSAKEVIQMIAEGVGHVCKRYIIQAGKDDLAFFKMNDRGEIDLTGKKISIQTDEGSIEIENDGKITITGTEILITSNKNIAVGSKEKIAIHGKQETNIKGGMVKINT